MKALFVESDNRTGNNGQSAEMMKNSYNAKEKHYEISPAWKSSLMNSIRKESDKNLAIEKRVIYFSWIAAGIAVLFLLASHRNLKFEKRRGQTEDRIGIVKNTILDGSLYERQLEGKQLKIGWGILVHNLWCLARMPVIEEDLAQAA